MRTLDRTRIDKLLSIEKLLETYSVSQTGTRKGMAGVPPVYSLISLLASAAGRAP